MVWNEQLKREIPEGWDFSKLENIATTYSGGTPTSTNDEFYNKNEVPWINSGELNSSFITETQNYISRLGLEKSSAKLYPSHSILIALYGATAGKVSYLSFEASSNQAVCGVMPHDKELNEYLFLALSSLCEHYVSISSGSARDNISQAVVKDTLLIIPPKTIITQLHNVLSNVFTKIIKSHEELCNLRRQRDELLPLLMNGQVSVMPPAVNCDLMVLWMLPYWGLFLVVGSIDTQS